MDVMGGRSVLVEENRMNIFMIIKFFLGRLRSQNIVEFGAYKGGNALFMASCLADLYPHARVMALDTFSGMPPSDPSLDLHRQGDFADANIEDLRRATMRAGIRNLEFGVGLSAETFPNVAKEVGHFGLAHIDCDIYTAVRYCQEAVTPFMVPGAYIVYDDACVSSCIGATQAVEEYIMQDRRHSEQIWPHFVFRQPEA
jgi:predicted O-methyltransferase YrrM